MFGQKPPLKKATAPWGQGEVYQPKSAHPGKLRSAVGDPVVHPKRSTPAPSKIQREARPWEQRGGTFRPKDAHTNAPKSNGNLIAHEKDSSAPSGKSKHTVEAPWGRGKEDSPKSPHPGKPKPGTTTPWAKPETDRGPRKPRDKAPWDKEATYRAKEPHPNAHMKSNVKLI